MSLIPYSDALSAIAASCVPGPEMPMAACEVLGAVQARTAIGVLPSPAFNNAAMDGFAVRAQDTSGATESSPVDLPVEGELRVGALAETAAPESPCAMRVATGALTPPPLNAVIAQERAEVLGRNGRKILRVTSPVERGRNLRLKGEEYPAGAAFSFSGTRLHAGHIALFSAAGITELAVRRPPPLGIITTGDEVRPPGADLASGQIVNVNAGWLNAWCAERRLPVAVSLHVADNTADLARELSGAREAGARLLITSGSASSGRRDVLKAALLSVGARIVFHGVAMRPGKPVMLALLADGTPVVGLAGNPLATAAGMRFIAWPGIRRILGLPAEPPRPVSLADAVELRKGFTHFQLAKRRDDDGSFSLVHPQRPAQAGALAAADCWLRIEGGRTESGASVDSYPL